MITLITPTGVRKKQFELCARWMRQQTYEGDVTWIIVDDGAQRTTDLITADFRPRWTIEKIYPKPSWSHGMNTQGRNLGEALMLIEKKYINSECIFVIEDDDYYKPNYLERMIANFENYDLVGEKNTIYYNVNFRRHITNANTAHASLFQTAFTPRLIPLVRSCLRHKFIDAELWRLAHNKHLFKEDDLAVGIKGMPGRAGIGAGHGKLMNMKQDFNLLYLKKLIGNDTVHYERYYSNNSQPRYDVLTHKRHR